MSFNNLRRWPLGSVSVLHSVNSIKLFGSGQSKSLDHFISINYLLRFYLDFTPSLFQIFPKISSINLGKSNNLTLPPALVLYPEINIVHHFPAIPKEPNAQELISYALERVNKCHTATGPTSLPSLTTLCTRIIKVMPSLYDWEGIVENHLWNDYFKLGFECISCQQIITSKNSLWTPKALYESIGYYYAKMKPESRISHLHDIEGIWTVLEDESLKKFVTKLFQSSVLAKIDRMTMGDSSWRFCGKCLLNHLGRTKYPCSCFICKEERKEIPTRFCRDRNCAELDKLFLALRQRVTKR